MTSQAAINLLARTLECDKPPIRRQLYDVDANLHLLKVGKPTDRELQDVLSTAGGSKWEFLATPASNRHRKTMRCRTTIPLVISPSRLLHFDSNEFR